MVWPRIQQGCRLKRSKGVAEDHQKLPSLQRRGNRVQCLHWPVRSKPKCRWMLAIQCSVAEQTSGPQSTGRTRTVSTMGLAVRTADAALLDGLSRSLVGYVCLSRPICGVVVRSLSISRYAVYGGRTRVRTRTYISASSPPQEEIERGRRTRPVYIKGDQDDYIDVLGYWLEMVMSGNFLWTQEIPWNDQNKRAIARMASALKHRLPEMVRIKNLGVYRERSCHTFPILFGRKSWRTIVIIGAYAGTR